MRDIAIVINAVAIAVGVMAFANWNAERAVMARSVQLEEAAEQGKEWMDDTTAKLESIHAGIERITGETVELARQIDSMADRMDRAGI